MVAQFYEDPTPIHGEPLRYGNPIGKHWSPNEGGGMYALFVEVDASEAHTDAAREFLNRVAAPTAREKGATAGHWLAPQGGRGVAVVVFDSEDAARAMSDMFTVGQAPMPDAPEGVKVRTVEVREVLASV